MTSCTVDYLTEDLKSSSYVLIYAIAVYFVPLLTLIYNYTFIVRAVSIHEENLRNQAKKMNVTSLRANADQQKQSAECRLAKVKLSSDIRIWNHESADTLFCYRIRRSHSPMFKIVRSCLKIFG